MKFEEILKKRSNFEAILKKISKFEAIVHEKTKLIIEVNGELVTWVDNNKQLNPFELIYLIKTSELSWGVYNEKKSLSDKSIANSGYNNYVYNKKDVREAVKK